MAGFGDFSRLKLGKSQSQAPSASSTKLYSIMEVSFMEHTSAYHGHITRDFRENPIHHSEHVPEMHSIAVEEINRIVPQMVHEEATRLFNEAVNAMMGALHYDIETSLEIAFKDLGEMYKDKRTQQFISNAICKAIEKRLNSIKLEFKL